MLFAHYITTIDCIQFNTSMLCRLQNVSESLCQNWSRSRFVILAILRGDRCSRLVVGSVIVNHES